MNAPAAPSNARRPMLLMCHDYPPLTGGGLAAAVNDLSRLLENDYEVTVVSARLVDHFADDRTHSRSRSRASTALAMVRLLRQADGLVVHWTFSFRWLSCVAVLVGPALGRPTVCVVHTSPGHCRYNRLRRLPGPARRTLLRLAAAASGRCVAVVALSTSHATALTEAGLKPTHTCPAPVTAPHGDSNIHRGHVRASAMDVVGFAGELSYLKGADALPALAAACAPEFAFRIAGRGPLEARVRSDIEGFDPACRSRIILSDRMDPARMAAFFHAIDAVLVLSRTESQCRLAIEAMLAGVVVLSRPVEGVRDLVDDGRTGFFIDPADPAAVRNLLRALRADPAELRRVRRDACDSARRPVDEAERAWPRLIAQMIGDSAKVLDLCRSKTWSRY
jgi:glycosyltransferase involved in cell wall biosynthesis